MNTLWIRIRAYVWGWQVHRRLDDWINSKDPNTIRWITAGPVAVELSRDYRDTGASITWAVLVYRIHVDYRWRGLGFEAALLRQIETMAALQGYLNVVVYGDDLAAFGEGYRLVRDDMYAKTVSALDLPA